MNALIAKGGFSDGLSTVGTALKNAALWTGRVIKEGCIKLAQILKDLWIKALPYLQTAAAAIHTFLKTAPGLAILGGLAGIVMALTAETLDDNKHVARAFRIAAAIAFIAMGIAIGVGITMGFTVPLI